MKLGLFNAKIRNEHRRYIHRLIYPLNEQDLLCHSIQNVSLILVTSLLDGGLKWVNFVIITVEKLDNGFVLVAHVVSRSTSHVPTLHVTFFAHAKFQHCEHSNYLVLSKKFVPGLAADDNTTLIRFKSI